jgi:hypothetical protein
MTGDFRPLESELKDARHRLDLAAAAAAAALHTKHEGGEWEEFRAVGQEVLRLERALAASRNEPYAEPFGFPVKWDIGAPLPFLLCNDYRTYLTFYMRDQDPDWDGTSVKIVNPASVQDAALCLVSFERCTSAKLGHPNDEAQHGHWLAGRGLEGYTAQVVKNSPWLKEVAKTNSAHRNDRPEIWNSLNHYVFWFHDRTFECLAESYEIEVTSESMPELLSRVQQKLIQ